MSTRLGSLLVLALVSLPAFGCAQDTTAGPPPVDDAELLNRAASSRLLGASAETADVTILEFFDYACSTCQNFYMERGDSLKALAREEGTALQLHSYIISRLPRGYPAAEAALCAGAVGGTAGFEAMNDRLLRNSAAWRDQATGPEPFKAWAVEIGLNSAQFDDCVDRDVTAPIIFSDVRIAGQFGVGGTPTFVFIPRGISDPSEAVSFYGNPPMSQFREALAEARSRVR